MDKHTDTALGRRVAEVLLSTPVSTGEQQQQQQQQPQQAPRGVGSPLLVRQLGAHQEASARGGEGNSSVGMVGLRLSSQARQQQEQAGGAASSGGGTDDCGGQVGAQQAGAGGAASVDDGDGVGGSGWEHPRPAAGCSSGGGSSINTSSGGSGGSVYTSSGRSSASIVCSSGGGSGGDCREGHGSRSRGAALGRYHGRDVASQQQAEGEGEEATPAPNHPLCTGPIERGQVRVKCLGAEALPHLTAITPFSHLVRELVLSGAVLERGHIVRHVAPVLPDLTSLKLSQCQIPSPPGSGFLKEVHRLSNLKRVQLHLTNRCSLVEDLAQLCVGAPDHDMHVAVKRSGPYPEVRGVERGTEYFTQIDLRGLRSELKKLGLGGGVKPGNVYFVD